MYLAKLPGAVRSNFYNSRNSAHLCAYRISLRPSLDLDPRHPPLRVIQRFTAAAVIRIEVFPDTVWLHRTPEKWHSGSQKITPSGNELFCDIYDTIRCANDPSAGSPTETLLRLLLPLSGKVH